MIKNKTKKTLLVFSMLLLGSSYNTFAVPPAHALTASGSISASGSVAGTCSVTASALSFGVLTSGGITRTSTVSPNCTLGTTYVITNSANTNNLYYNNTVSATAANIIAFPIVLTGGTDAFTLSNASTGYLGGTGTGDVDALVQTLSATTESSAGKTEGSYAGTVILTITY
jgi:spore coat protein U-like protein